MPSFDQAYHFIINCLSQTDIRNDCDQRAKDDAFKLLQQQMVDGAGHDSGERYDAPKCHPETRIAVLKSIMSWADSSDRSSKILWLYGPAGAGKSAIAQTTAEQCHIKGELAASFFFFRFAAGRNRKDGLVATIAFQICISIPAAKEHIISNIEKNPKIFKSNIKTQLKVVVFDPLRSVDPNGVIPRLIIIDGLDECKIRKDQAEIIEAISNLVKNDSSRLRFMLVSRPEVEIRQAFNSDEVASFCIRLALDETFEPDKDIKIFLRSQFHTLRRQHLLNSSFPEFWPSDECINQLAMKSSGQFICASTIIHYIADPRHNPLKRLDVVLKTIPAAGESPFAELDALYSTILSVCKDYSKVAMVFETIMFFFKGKTYSSGDDILKSAQYLDKFLSFNNEVLILLADLHSVVDVFGSSKIIRFYHASMDDFLQEPSRSREFHIQAEKAHARLSKHCIDHVINMRSELPMNVYNYSLECCFYHFASSLWDDDVFNYIQENGLLKRYGKFEKALVINSFCRPEDSSMTSRMHGYRSAVTHLIHTGLKKVYRREDVAAKLRDLIDGEILGRLRQEEVFYCYYFVIASRRHNAQFPPYLDDVNNVMEDIMGQRTKIAEWFMSLVDGSQCMINLSDTSRVRCISEALDRITTKRYRKYYTSVTTLLELMFNDTPASVDIEMDLRHKWKSIEKSEFMTSDMLISFSDIIESYFERCISEGASNMNMASGPAIEYPNTFPSNNLESTIGLNDQQEKKVKNLS